MMNNNMKIDYMKPGYQRVAIKDKTKNSTGQPTFKAMERVLYKMMRV
jgi:hypothetical protein